MSMSVTGVFIYENLKEIHSINSKTSLCILPDTNKLYIMKREGCDRLDFYRTMSKIDNPNLARLVHVEDRSDFIEVIFEYVCGDTLADLINKNINEDAAIRIIADVCNGLSAMHRHGLVHRDINPNNIIVTEDGRAKIIDFGISRSFATDKRNDTAILGTVGYAAPEQFGFTQSDARTDIYAVGVLINVIFTGRLPGEEPLCGDIGKIVKKCIEIDAARRYNSIDDLAVAVNNRIPAISPVNKLLMKIPGFRSRHVSVNIIALFLYVLLGVFSAAMFTTDAKTMRPGYIALSYFFLIIVPYFALFNFLDIWNKFPFTRGADKKTQRLIYITTGIISLFIGLLIIGTTYHA